MMVAMVTTMKIPPADPEQNFSTPVPELSGDDPFKIFAAWMEAAIEAEPADANAMTLATVDAGGMPDSRMVLMKSADERGLVFYTNLGSRKARQLAASPKASLSFHWKSLLRQIRFQGLVEPVGDAEADAYFQSRDRRSRIGAWASRQSQPLKGRFELEAQIAKFAAKFAIGDIPRPAFWSGYRVVPLRIEFWRNGAFRLHDRLVFERETPVAPWQTSKLYP